MRLRGRMTTRPPRPPRPGVDQTAELQALIDKRGGTLDLKGKTFKAAGEIRITGSGTIRNLTLDGSGRVEGRTGLRHLFVESAKDLTLENVNVVGPHTLAGGPAYPGWETPTGLDAHGWHGIAVHGSSNVTLKTCSAHHTFGDALYIGKTKKAGVDVATTDLLVDGGAYEYTGRQGVGIVAADRFTLKGVFIQHARANLVDMEPADSDMPLSNGTITGCTFGAHRTYVVVITGPGAVGMCHTINITDNKVTSPSATKRPVVLAASVHSDRHGLTVTGNTQTFTPPDVWANVTGWGNTLIQDK